MSVELMKNKSGDCLLSGQLEIPDAIIPTLQGFLDEGCRIAVYQNHDLSHSGLGSLAYLKVGRTAPYKEAPERLPDSRIGLGWRDILVAIISDNFDGVKVIQASNVMLTRR